MESPGPAPFLISTPPPPSSSSVNDIKKLPPLSKKIENTSSNNTNSNNTNHRTLAFDRTKPSSSSSSSTSADITNEITTSKYTWYNFLPLFLLESFSKMANFFFLVVSVCQAIPEISNTFGIPTNAPVLLFVLTIDAIFVVIEDIRRHQADADANGRKAVLEKGGAVISWSDIRVGDFIVISNRDIIPADVIIWECPSKSCYVETKSLDGETNLKLRSQVEANFNMGTLAYELPNDQIETFNGTLNTSVPVSAKNLLLRGCVLRNTSKVVGLVINTGVETKIMQSICLTSTSKWSAVMLLLNKLILYLVMFLVALCALAATINSFSSNDEDDDDSWIVVFFQYFLLLYQIIPISLYVSMTMVKFCQATFIRWDLYMNYNETPTLVRSMNLNEELGQISHVFTDKTGTLTCNEMEFKKCSIAGKSYGSDRNSDQRIPYVNFVDDTLNSNDKDVQSFFRALALCHTVIPEVETNTLSASSPDESALVAMASVMGFEFKSRESSVLTIEEKNQDVLQAVSYQVLHVLEFNSTRKRMSVIIKDSNNVIKLICKGADCVLWPRMISDSLKKQTMDHLDDFATIGLRTLLVSERILSLSEYKEWNAKYTTALLNLEEIKKHHDGIYPNAIDSLADEIETDLKLLGASAIEDKLQEHVRPSLEGILNAGIKVWMLTGDKVETAINIATSCGLLTLETTRYVFDNEDTIDNIENRLVQLVNEPRSSDKTALVIDGKMLQEALKFPEHFVALAVMCETVLCCRVSPSQKAAVVNLVRKALPSARTLAIGDGNNDVGMIHEAHVGVGISGHEGRQAVNASDYAIGRFYFLQRLLLVHGHWNYNRIVKLVLYMFYKNTVLALVQYWYSVFTANASGVKLYWEIGSQVYNIFFTGLPIVLLAIFDRDVPARYCVIFPALYHRPSEVQLTVRRFVLWIILSIAESLLIFVIVILSASYASRVEIGMTSFALVVWVVNLKIWLITSTWTHLSLLLWLGSLLSWYVIASIFSTSTTGCHSSIGFDECGAFANVIGTSSEWYTLLLGCVTTMLVHWSWNQYQRMTKPALYQVLQEKLMLESNLQLADSEIMSEEDEDEINENIIEYNNNIAKGNERNNSVSNDIRRSIAISRRRNNNSSLISSSTTNADNDGSTNNSRSGRRSGFAFSGDEETLRAEAGLVVSLQEEEHVTVLSSPIVLYKEESKEEEEENVTFNRQSTLNKVPSMRTYIGKLQ